MPATGQRDRTEIDWQRITTWVRLADAQRRRAVTVTSQALFPDYDPADTGLAEEPVAEAPAIEEAEQPAKPKRRRRTQAA